MSESLAVMTAKVESWISDGIVDERSFCCFVDDGSVDGTWTVLTRELKAPHRALRLAFNAGHQRALHAGLSHVSELADCCVSVDADLQDDLDVVPEMLDASGNGADIVYGVRAERDTDTFFKRTSARLFYRISSFLGVPGGADRADFRLLTAKAMRAVAAFGEYHLYLRALLASMGLPSATVSYKRRARIGGTTKYSPGKMLLLASDGITSFSVVPLRLITFAGMLLLLSSLLAAAYLFVRWLFDGSFPSDLGILTVSLYFLGGAISLALGIMGEYLGKIFIESKKRPSYIVETLHIADSPPEDEK